MTPPAIDLLSGREDWPAEDLLYLIEQARGQVSDRDIGALVEVLVTRALDQHVESTGWHVEGARPDWRADAVLTDPNGVRRILVEANTVRSAEHGWRGVDEPIGRATRMRSRISREWGHAVDYWIVFATDPGPKVVEAFEDAGVTVGWIESLPDLPSD